MSLKVSRMFRVRNKLAREALAEFFGTFILMTFGDGSEAQALLSRGVWGSFMSIYWCWGIAVMMGVFVAGGISGGHINPSITVAKACLGYFPWKKVPVYILAQYAGSFVASVVVYAVYIDALNHYDGGVRAVEGATATAAIWATYPQTYVSTWNCLGDQILGTALLLICILAITDKNNIQPSPGITVVTIGLSVVAIGMSFGLNCAYAINPTRDLAPRIFTAIAGWGKAPFSFRNYNFFWVPVVGPHVGAILGAFLYQLFVGLHWSDNDDVKEEPTTNGKVVKNHNPYNGPGLSIELPDSDVQSDATKTDLGFEKL